MSAPEPTKCKGDILFALNDAPSLRISVLAAIQHFLAIVTSVVAPPMIMCQMCGASRELTVYMLSMSLLMSGIATFIQIHRFGPIGSGLLSIQGTSSAFLPVYALMAAQGLAEGAGPEKILGLILCVGCVCAVVEVVLSQSIRWIRSFITPTLSGVVITLMGCNLIQIAARQIGGGPTAQAGGTFGEPVNILLALFSILVVLVMSRLRWMWCRVGALMFGLIGGTLLAAALGRVSLGDSWVWAPQVPELFRLPFSFRWEWVLPMALMYVIATVETLGDITATSLISGEPIEGKTYEKRVSGGLLADGLNTMFVSLFGSFPTTSFSQNNGVIQMTGVASRRIGRWIAVFLILAGILPFLGNAFLMLPAPVFGGVALVMFGSVAAAGIRLLVQDGTGRKNSLVMTIGLGVGLSAMFMPSLYASWPDWSRALFGNGIISGMLAALAAQLILGRDEPATIGK